MTEMKETSSYQPTPRLPLTESERVLIDSVIDDMVRGVRRSVISIGRPTLINSHPRESAILDKLIEGGIDKLRPVLKNDFYEKMFDRLSQRCDTEPDDATCSMGLLWLRALDSLKLVLSMTKKYRGKPHPAPYPESEAKDLLKQRGLWKR